MSTNTLVNLLFLAVFLYYLCPMKLRWVMLLGMSYVIFAQGGRQALCFILLTTLSTWAGALLIGRIGARSKADAKAHKADWSPEERKLRKARARSKQRVLFFLTLILNFGVLCVVKYFPGLPGKAASLLLSRPLSLKLFVPLGISFYTFQSMGYLIDVYNGKIQPERNPAKFALFVSFFPQLVQGPIGRYDALAPQLVTPHKLELANIRRGLTLMLWGFFKKKVIADRAFPMIDQVFGDHTPYGGAVIAFAVLLYSLQQYADFSGGIDLVTGASEMMGIHLAPNFKRPYFSVSLGDFWRRWHISLGAWMRDYVFYPFALTRPMRALSKALKAHVGVNISRTLPAALGNILVFLLVGVWHGATSNYVLWGLYNGLILAFSALAEPAYKRFGARRPELVASKGFHVFRILRTFLIVNIGWYFDRCARGMDAFAMLGKTLFAPQWAQIADGTLLNLSVVAGGAATPATVAMDYVILALAALLLFAVSAMQERGIAVREWVQDRPLPLRWALLYLLLFFTMFCYVSGSNGSFMYAAF